MMKPAGMIAALLLAGMLAAPAAAAQVAAEPVPSILHVFGDWTVACDNGRRCQASSLMPEGEADIEKQRFMRVERAPEAEAALSVHLVDIERTPVRLRLDDETIDAAIRRAGDDEWQVEPRSPQDFLAKVPESGKLIVQDAAGAAIGEITISGLREALLYMDEVQGRIGTVTALVATGRRPASAVPPTPALPVVSVARISGERPIRVSSRRIAQLRRDARCGSGASGSVGSWALGKGRTLLLVDCKAGPYNFGSVPFLVTREGRELRFTPARFDLEPGWGVAEDPEEPSVPQVINAQFNPATMTLSEDGKSRGLGDCGVRSTYGWDGDRFRLIERQEMGQCRGSHSYLSTWRTQGR
jgi:hypothetical protein